MLCARINPPRLIQCVAGQDIPPWRLLGHPASNFALRRAPHTFPDDHHHRQTSNSPDVRPHPPQPQHGDPPTANTTAALPTARDTDNLPRLVALINELFAADVTVDEMASIIQHLQQSQRWMAFLRDARRVRNLAMHLAIGPSPASVHHLLVLANKLGTHFKSGVHEGLAFEFARQKKWHLIPPLVDLAHIQLGKSSLRLLNWLTRSISEQKDYAALDSILQTFSEHNVTPDRRTYHIIIKAHLTNHDLGRARECMQIMVEAGIDVDASTYATLVCSYRGLGPDKMVQAKAYHSIPHLNSKTGTLIANSMLRIAIDRGDAPGALKILRMFDGLDRDTLSSALSALAYVDSKSFPPHEDSSQLVHADLATFTNLINILAEHRDLNWLNHVVERMKAACLSLDAEVAAALIRAHFAQNSGRLALKVLYDFCGPIHTRLQSSLFKELGYYAEEGDPTFGPFSDGPSVAAFNAVLQCALPRRGYKCLNPILRLMQSFGVTPSSATVEILLSYTEKIGASPSQLVTVGSSISNETALPSVLHVNILLRRLMRAEKRAISKCGWNALGAFVRGVTKPPKRPDPPAELTTDMTGPTSGLLFPASWSQHNALSGLVQNLSERGVKGTRATFALRMRHAALSQSTTTGGPTARQILNVMVARGMHPTAHHYAALMEAHTVAGDMPAAHSVLREAVAQIQPPQKSLVVLHTLLISGYARLGRPDRAMRTFQNMIRENVAPDAAAVDAVVSAFFAVKAFKLARDVLLELWPMVAPPVDGMRNASLLELLTKLRSMRSIPGQQQHRTESSGNGMERRLRKVVRLWQRLFSPSVRPPRFRRQSPM